MVLEVDFCLKLVANRNSASNIRIYRAGPATWQKRGPRAAQWFTVNFHSNRENSFAENVFVIGHSILNQTNLANKVPQKVTFIR